MRAPAITDAEIDRLRPLEQFGIGLLILPREFGDRAGIAAKGKETPLPRAVIGERNPGIVLNYRRAVGENEVAHAAEIAGMQKVRCALDQAVAGRERRAEFQEARRLDAGIGKIG